MAHRSKGPALRIDLTSVHVDDRRAARAFYTDVLGFTVRHDVPLGDSSSLTVVSPYAPEGPELLLEPAGHPAVQPYRDALVARAQE
jgi:catechol 2,3-dioxygenase-like lactoylglutathione lyase family enzyme